MDNDDSMGRTAAEIIANAARGSGIRRASQRGRTISLTFGSSEVRDLSDGQFPVEVWRCILMEDGTQTDEHQSTVTKAARLKRAASAAGQGWRPGSKQQWVELRTPTTRMAVESR